MNSNQIVKALKTCGLVRLTPSHAANFRSFFWHDPDLLSKYLVDSTWLGELRDLKFGQPDFKKDTVTYTDCYAADVTLHEDKVRVDLRIFDGDSLYGEPCASRCMFTFDFEPTLTPVVVANAIKRDALEYAREQVMEEERRQFEQKVNAKFTEIFGV